jgi:hypothetical protein
MDLPCPQCQSPVPASNVNIQELAAKCDRCQTVFFFDRDGSRPDPPARPAVELPDGMKVSRMLGELELSYSWRRHASGFLLVFGLFWNAMLIPFVLVAVSSGQYMIFLGIGLHLLVGIGLLYYILASFLNSTYITVTSFELQIEHRPLPVPMRSKRVLSARQIAQLYTSKYTSSRTNGQPNWSFAVDALLQNQSRVRLLSGLKTAGYARYLEQEIERFLNLEDRRVKEEWTGPYT